MNCVMTPPTNPQIGARLRELRGNRTQHEIAMAVGVKPAAVSLWEKGGTVARKNAEAYDRALGANGEVLALLGYTEPNVPAFTTIDAKLDRILELLEGGGRRPRFEGGDGTPTEMPRPALKSRGRS